MEVKRIYLLVHPYFEMELRSRFGFVPREFRDSHAKFTIRQRMGLKEYRAFYKELFENKWKKEIERASQDPHAILVLMGLGKLGGNPLQPNTMRMSLKVGKEMFQGLNQEFQALARHAREKMGRRMIYVTRWLDEFRIGLLDESRIPLFRRLLKARDIKINPDAEILAFGEYKDLCVNSEAEILKALLKLKKVRMIEKASVDAFDFSFAYIWRWLEKTRLNVKRTAKKTGFPEKVVRGMLPAARKHLRR